MISSQFKAALALLVFVVSALACEIANGRALAATPKQQADANVNDAAPEFQLQQVNGQTISLADLRGHPAVIIFWTSWCPICKAEAPEFNRLMRRHRASGIRVLGINIQESEKRTRAGIKDFGIRYPVARDGDASVARRYQVTATPTVIFLDAEGVIKYRGTRLPEDYDRRLEALLMQHQQPQLEGIVRLTCEHVIRLPKLHTPLMRTSVSLYHRHRFPAEIISHSVWLYFRFALSFRDVEEMLAMRGVTLSYETIREWCLKFGQTYANGLRRRSSRPGDRWHLDEVFLKNQWSAPLSLACG